MGIVEYFLPEGMSEGDSVERRRATLAIRAVLAGVVWGPIVGVMYWMAGSIDAVYVVTVGTLAIILTPIILKWTRSLDAAGTYLLVTLTAMLVGLCFLFDGIESPSLTWLVLVPVFAVLFQGIRRGAIWLGIVMICFAGLATAEFLGYPFAAQLDPDMLAPLRVVEAAGLASIVFAAYLFQDRLLSWLIDVARARETETNLVLETAPDGIVTIDLDGEVVSSNDAASEIFGRPRNAIVGHQIRDLIATVDAETMSDGNDEKSEHRAVRDDGSTFPVEVAVGVFNGDVREGAVLVFRDIADRKQAEEALQDARDDAIAASRAKSDFLANMSHELRTPLNAVIGYSEMLIEEFESPPGFGKPESSLTDQYIPDLQRIQSAGKHLLALINDILDLSKIEAGKMTTHVELVDVREMLDAVIGTIQPLADKNGNVLELTISDSVGFIRSDKTKLRQILFNLLSNACKFTSDGKVTLEARRSDAGDGIIFEVRDTGIGMSEDQLEHIFEAFTQADSSTTREFGGTGLGLTITHHFCSLLGGGIEVESDKGEGSRFVVELDADLDGAGEEQPMPAFDEPTSLGAERSFVEPSVVAEDIVLVIDDDPTIRNLLQRILEREGFQVATAASAGEGLVLAEQLEPAVITLDVMMPTMDGWTLLSKLKEDPALRSIPVVMISIVDEHSRGFALGASDYLVKPVDREQLADVMARYRSGWDESERGSLLLVEDDEPTRSLFRRTLRDDGWNITEAENGAVGLEVLDEARPDLIVLDLMMPKMGGFEFLRRLRQRDGFSEVPVVVVTAKELSEAEHATLLDGASEVVAKGGDEQSEVLEDVRKLVLRVAESAEEGGLSSPPSVGYS